MIRFRRRLLWTPLAGFGLAIGAIGPGLLLVPACLSPEGAPGDFRGPWTPRAVLERSVEAHGGREAVLDFQDLSQEQEIVVLRQGSPLKGETLIRFMPPDRLFFVLRLEGGDEKVVFFDGRESGERINGKGTSRDVEVEILRWRRLIRIHAFFLEHEALGVKLADPVQLEAMRCALLTKAAPGETWRIWIDLNHFFIRRVRLELPLGDPLSGIKEPLTVDRRYHDFQPMEGRQVPMEFEIFLNGALFQKGRVVRFRMNAGLEEKDFRCAARGDPL